MLCLPRCKMVITLLQLIVVWAFNAKQLQAHLTFPLLKWVFICNNKIMNLCISLHFILKKFAWYLGSISNIWFILVLIYVWRSRITSVACLMVEDINLRFVILVVWHLLLKTKHIPLLMFAIKMLISLEANIYIVCR